MRWIKTLILDALFPFRCFCGRWGVSLCGKCYSKVPKNKTQLCPSCKKIAKNGKTCISCRNKSYLTGVLIFGDHEGILKDIIWRYKYEFVRNLAEPLSEMLVEKFGQFVRRKQFILTFVPASKQRQRWRGFNQSAAIAKQVADKTDMSFEALLVKQGRTSPQVGLSKKQRIKNIEGKIKAISVARLKIEGKRILIVDDVYTTGATLEECARVLRQAGAREVWGLVLSRD